MTDRAARMLLLSNLDPILVPYHARNATTPAFVLDPTFKHDADVLLGLHEFQSWFSQNTSCLVFVNGLFTHPRYFAQPSQKGLITLTDKKEAGDLLSPEILAEYPSFSPLSHACGRMVTDLTSKANNIVLSYFCAFRMDCWDPNHSPREMLCGLIMQLRGQCKDFNQGTWQKEHISELEFMDIDWLSMAFIHLMKKVPATHTVYCIIDGTNFYQHGKDLDEVLNTLKKALYEDEIKMTFRCLMTNPCGNKWSTVPEDLEYVWNPALPFAVNIERCPTHGYGRFGRKATTITLPDLKQCSVM